MAADKELISKKHQAVRNRFKKLCQVTTKGGKKKYTYAAILEMLGEEFFYKDDTVEKIISK